MNTARLLRLAEELEKPGQKLHMFCWDRCAIGIACRIPEFIAAGLSLQKIPFMGLIPCYDNLLGFYAASLFFDITHTEAGMLFGCVPSTALKKAREIREMVAKHEAAQVLESVSAKLQNEPQTVTVSNTPFSDEDAVIATLPLRV